MLFYVLQQGSAPVLSGIALAIRHAASLAVECTVWYVLVKLRLAGLMVRRAADQSSAFALLEHADEEGFIENLDEVLEQLESSTRAAKPAKVPKQKQQAGAKVGTAKAAVGTRPNSSTATASSSRAAAQKNDAGAISRAEDYYRAFEHVHKDVSTGEVVLRFHKTNIVRIKPNGDVSLTSGGWFTYTTWSAMNDALYALRMTVSYQGAVTAGSWAVTDDAGRIIPFQDNMVIAATRPEHRGRGTALLHAYAGGGEVPIYATKVQAAGLAPRSSAAGIKAGATTGAMRPMQPGSHANTAATSGSYARTAQAARTQQRDLRGPGTTAQHQAGPRKTVHEQLQEAVQQLGLEDELACGDEHLCVVCLEHHRNEVLVPCGHMVLCSFCCEDIIKASNECPVCRETIIDHCMLDAHDA